MLRSPIQVRKSYANGKLKSSTISLKAFSWGKIYAIPNAGLMHSDYFLLHYFGYVAAKYLQKTA